MSKKVLIAYGTRYGSARITAGEIADSLKAKGHHVSLIDLKKERPPADPASFDLIVAGSSIAMFMWLGRVKGFLRRCKRIGVPTAVWINCGMAIEEPGKARAWFYDKVINRIGIKPVESGIFGPVLDFTPDTGLPEGLKNRIKGTVQAMAKDGFKADGIMDMRRREDVDAFCAALAALL